ncbi:MAG: hypothetical protein IJN42_07950 [Clostridia bacterium]|nr:hypothetical protein [Clostridia bacterium]
MCKKKQDNNWPVPAHMNDENWLKTMESWKGTWRDDYRIMNQEMYLKDRELIYMKFNPSICFEDYRQCEFCGDIFDEDPDNLLNAYREPVSRTWICEECYNDFKPYFNWTVKPDPSSNS